MSYIGSPPADQTSGAKPRDEFVGTGSQTNFTLSQEVPGGFESAILVVVDNVLQQPIESYTIQNNNTLVFSEAPASGSFVYVLHQGNATYNMIPVTGSVTPDKLSDNLRNFTVNTFTGNGSTVNYTLTEAPASANAILVIVSGLVKTRTTDYTVSGTTLTFVSAPASSAPILVVHLGFSTVSRTGLVDGSVTTTKLASGAAVANIGYTPANNSDVIHNTGDETIGGIKTFSSFPIYPAGMNGLYKNDPSAVVFTKTGVGTATIKAGTIVDVSGKFIQFLVDTNITMPTLTAGTDYAIWVNYGGTIQATTSFITPPAAGSRKIGGFHYAPGGNATGTSGGNTTPQINEYSFWDVNFRPSSSDARGMAFCSGVWVDIYLCNTDYITNGTSSYNKTIADGASPPKMSPAFGGTGSNSYSSLNWYEANEVMRYAGKRLPTLTEFHTFAYGTTENSAIGSDQVNTILNAGYTSKYGIIQSTGVMWIWSQDTALRSDIGGGFNWYNTTGGRGNNYEFGSGSAIRVLLGGHWGEPSNAGSRCSSWNDSPATSSSPFGLRGVCDHLVLA